jgi:tetraacyldisaccharide 4'-kinase
MAWLEAFLLREWQQGSGWQLLLRPISWFYQTVVAARRAMFSAGILKSHRVSVPVIVIGNITVGGTGKTPIVLELAKRLTAYGMQPGIITRGYTRRSSRASAYPRGVIHVVAPTMSPPTVESDEAILLAERSGVPVFAGARRFEAARALLQAFPSTSVIISDDGLQHYALKRDVEVAVFDATRGIGNGATLPAGALREPIGRLRKVDCVVLNNPNPDKQLRPQLPDAAVKAVVGAMFESLALELVLAASEVPIFEMQYRDARMVKLGTPDTKRATDVVSPDTFIKAAMGKRVTAIAGIGNPGRFFSHVRGLGISLDDVIEFPDHHDYRIQDLREIDADLILMTEKDAVKCRQFAGVDERLWMMQVDADLPDAFFEFVLKKISHVT